MISVKVRDLTSGVLPPERNAGRTKRVVVADLGLAFRKSLIGLTMELSAIQGRNETEKCPSLLPNFKSMKKWLLPGRFLEFT